MQKIVLIVYLGILSTLMSGCLTLPDANERRIASQKISATHGWEYKTWQASGFELAGFSPEKLTAPIIRIYIEGDGLAWITSRRPSKNPTPVNPVALKMALADDMPSVYLARPCQFVSLAFPCAMKYWTSHRYAEEVIAATSQAVSQIKKQTGARQVELFGYSGGGAVAALVAARRDDVARLVTVAGNLDHAFWTAYHKVSPLAGSLNPVDFAQQLSLINQMHFVGGDDDNVPVDVFNEYKRYLPVTDKVKLQVVPGYDHECCWVENWGKLLNRL